MIGKLNRRGAIANRRSLAPVTNVITNGDFETNTTGWAPVGSKTLTSSADQAKFGSKSLKITVNVANDPRHFYWDTAVVYSAAVPHTLSCWIFLPTAWDTGVQAMRIDPTTHLTGYTGDQYAFVDLSKRDQWQYCKMTYTPAGGDLSGGLLFENSSVIPGVGQFFYVDGIQIEAHAWATPFVEGTRV